MKQLVNKALLLEQLKRYWPIAALAMLGYLLLVVQSIYTSNNTAQRMIELMTMRNPIMLVAMVAIPLFTALALFAYPYRTASVTAYHSLPMSRTQLFTTHVFVGLILMIGPLILFSIIILAMPVPLPPSLGGIAAVEAGTIAVHQTINNLPRVAVFLLRTSLGFVMYFALCTLAATLAGNRIIALIWSAVIAFAPIALVALVGVIGSYYVFGMNSLGIVEQRVIIFTHPIGWATGLHNLERSSLWFVYYAWYIFLTIIYLAGAYFTNRMRPHERAGDAVAFLPVKRIMIFLLAVMGMVILGVFWLIASGSRVGYYAGFIVGFIVAYFIAQMIAEKTFRVGHKVKYLFTYGAVAAGIYAVILLVTIFGFWGYVRRVPETAEITGVSVWRNQWEHHNATQSGMDHFITDPGTIAQIQYIHQGAVDRRGTMQGLLWGTDGTRTRIPLVIEYRLADGSTLMRSYILNEQFFHLFNVHELMQTGPVLLSQLPQLRHPEVIASIHFNVLHHERARFQSALERAQIEAERDGVTVETALGDRAYILYLTGSQQRWNDVSTTYQVAELARIILADEILPRHVVNRSAISIEINIREVEAATWGRRWHNSINVPLDGYTGDWLRKNGFLPETIR